MSCYLRTRRLKYALKDHTRGPRGGDGIRRYVHLGTGNYNDSTAKLYTDCGIMTAIRLIGEDATAVFTRSGYSEPLNWKMLSGCPAVAQNEIPASDQPGDEACKRRKAGIDHCEDEFPLVTRRSSPRCMRRPVQG